MPEVSCSHPDCLARMPRRVNFCPVCGARQEAKALPRVLPVRAVAEAPPAPAVRSAPTVPVAPAARVKVPAPERKTGIGFWIVALAVMFTFWLSFSDDEKPAQSGKLRHNAGQEQRK
jgi:anti-sigma factor RsiW